MSVLPDFHPILAEWFSERLGVPTPCQKAAWPLIKNGSPVLIAAPTGSGKTLAAFLCAVDRLLWQAASGDLEDGVQVLYVSPLRALSHDVHENLERPLAEIMARLRSQCPGAPAIRAAVRTGDTPASAREAMRRRPPHILVTTPESLYVLLTSASGREALGRVSTVIVDEIHALIGSKRGAHLALTLERLSGCTRDAPQRIGLSATQRPIAQVADFLRGRAPGRAPCEVVDLGHARPWDLSLVLPSTPLTAVLSAEAQGEIYDQMVTLIREHRATLIFVNTRRLAERVSRALAERLAEQEGDADQEPPPIPSWPGTTTPRVLAHHGSLSRAQRLEAERCFKSGQLDALVATASLELGIDVGEVDLVVQLGSPRSLSTLLQRIGRACHQVNGVPRGRLFPQTRDDLVECIALLDMVERHELDALLPTPAARDVLAQQIVAECSVGPINEPELLAWVRAATPYAETTAADFESLLAMLADGFVTNRGRRAAYLHRDRVNHRIMARPGARLVALTCGGAIPDQGDYDVVLEPEGQIIGTVNEDFAIDSVPGNVFQLGTSNWRVLRVEGQTMRVADAGGAPPNMPFWFGEAPGRTMALSEAVGRLRAALAAGLLDGQSLQGLRDNLARIPGVGAAAASQATDYLAASCSMLGDLPTSETLILERFFDDAGGMQLVLHAPLGVRINRAFGLGLRKRFCKQFNFELQAAATDNAVVISLGAVHSFELESVWAFLHPASARDVVIQALLDAPMFPVRWRWVTTCALAVPRFRQGKKVPPQIQRMAAEDLVALVFPDQIACQENISGPRRIPDHPLVEQVLEDCLNEVMDIQGLINLLEAIRNGTVKTIERDTTEPSPLAAEILAANPYAFLDDAPLEERRTRAITPRRHVSPLDAPMLGRIEPEAVNAVLSALQPRVSDPEGLHDALVLAGFLTEREVHVALGIPFADEPHANPPGLFAELNWPEPLQQLIREGRTAQLRLPGGALCWVAAERLAEMTCLFGSTARINGPPAPPHLGDFQGERMDALMSLLKSRLELTGPITCVALAQTMQLAEPEIEQALRAIEQQGFALKGHFTAPEQWCERRILARITRASVRQRRTTITPVAIPHFVRFLFHRHGMLSDSDQGPVAETLHRLTGALLSPDLLESMLLPTRIQAFHPDGLDATSLSGEFLWFQLPVGAGALVVIPAAYLADWRTWISQALTRSRIPRETLPERCRQILSCIEENGAPFLRELSPVFGHAETLNALAILIKAGFVRTDGFAGFRALGMVANSDPGIIDMGKLPAFADVLGRAGRFSVVDRCLEPVFGPESASVVPRHHDLLVSIVGSLLERYGVVSRQIIEHEMLLPSWRDLRQTLRSMELSGDVVAGRFLAISDGEQYAAPKTLSELRAFQMHGDQSPECYQSTGALASRFLTLSAMDPLHLSCLTTKERTVARRPENFLIFKDGELVAARTGGRVDVIRSLSEMEVREVRAMLLRRAQAPTSAALLAG